MTREWAKRCAAPFGAVLASPLTVQPWMVGSSPRMTATHCAAPLAYYVRCMLILAIDTALDACAAAVLDTEQAELLAQEQLPMKRGHAEALMPLIARVMLAADVASPRLTGSRSPRAPEVSLACASGSRRRAASRLPPAAGRGLTTLSAYAAASSARRRAAPVISAIDARHDHVYFQIVGGDGSQLIARRSLRSRRRSRPRVSARRIWSAMPRRSWPSAGRRCTATGRGRCATRARHRLGRMARRRGDPETAPARPFYLRAPDAKAARATAACSTSRNAS